MRWPSSLAVLYVLIACAPSCTDKPVGTTNRAGESDRRTVIRQEPIEALPDRSDGGRLVALGEKLFHETRLSGDGSISCATCHEIAKGGDDGRERGVGIGGRVGTVNVPTVLNSGNNFAQFWDGRAKTLEEQIDGPVLDAAEMGGNWEKALAALRTDSEYRTEFGSAFSDGITVPNVKSAIAAFERTLTTPKSRFDRWLKGEAAALSSAELAGYELFKSVGCIACHQGRNVGGNMFQRFGVMGDYFRDRGGIGKADWGRFNVTGEEADRFVFKVPSLRNVELTAPYFHDGSAKTLPDAVRVMARYQLGRRLVDAEVESLVTFLKSLTGQLPANQREANTK